MVPVIRYRGVTGLRHRGGHGLRYRDYVSNHTRAAVFVGEDVC